MKRFVCSTLFLIRVLSSWAQDHKWAIEANYPVLLGDENSFRDYNGVIDIGIKYSFIDRIGEVRGRIEQWAFS
ncbi:hypothetical protein [Pareuzebyella sediminis]|uniref:hypothetical protein n=1 Tax=Pareuzebyella sediminis TaxID=2607998 RepID=UPI0011EEF465|nr:hypothetical protein [Pareuzebyella sediminis]